MARGSISPEDKQRWLRERHVVDSSLPELDAAVPAFAERHYAPRQIADLWGLSVDAVRRLFEKEPGVLVIGDSLGRAGKRRYATLRIPESVMERVHRRSSVVGA